MVPSRAGQFFQRLLAGLDQLLFIKRGYSFYSHLIPFAVAALLLLVLSLPQDNLLLVLAGKLETPGSLLLPALLLTAVAALVYLASMLATVRQAYLWPAGDWRRTVLTAALYAGLCSLMAYLVLNAFAPQPLTPGRVWASSLLALLSLTGLGWSLPSKWVESIGVNVPDYTAGRRAASALAATIRRVRAQLEPTTLAESQEALKAAQKLLESIDANWSLEPAWAQAPLASARQALQGFITALDGTFIKGDRLAQADFGVASNCQKASVYADYTAALRAVGQAWPELQCP